MFYIYGGCGTNANPPIIGFVAKYYWLCCGLLVFQRLIHLGIIAALSLFLASLREVAHTLKVSNDTSHIVHILASAVWALLQIAFVDVSTVVADSVWNVKREV